MATRKTSPKAAAPAKKAAPKLDIFKLLDRIDSSSCDLGSIWNSLTEDERKGFTPYTLIMWMSMSPASDRQIIFLNEVVNRRIFPLAKHPELLMMLFQASSDKTKKRYFWKAPKTAVKAGANLRLDILSRYYNISRNEANKLSPMPPDEELIEMLEELGCEEDELKKTVKQLKKTSEDSPE